MKKRFLIFVTLVALTGCSHATELVKTIWGSSTRALEKARQDAVQKTFRCNVDDCYNTVLALTQIEEEQPAVVEEEEDADEASEEENPLLVQEPVKQGFDLFLENRRKQHIVVMGVPGSVDTTEVGIFFIPVSDDNVRIEVSSLSTNAKSVVAEMIFKELGELYPEE